MFTAVAWLPHELQARRTTVHKATASVDQQLERLTDAYLHAILSRAEYQRRRQDLECKLQTLAIQAKQLDAQVDRRAETAGLATSITDFCQRVQAGLAPVTFEQRRPLVELLIDRVLVANGEVEIRYVFPTHPRSEMIRFCHVRKDYFQMIVQVAVGAMAHGFLQRGFDGSRIGVMPIGPHPLWHTTSDGPCGMEERFGRLRSSRLTVWIAHLPHLKDGAL